MRKFLRQYVLFALLAAAAACSAQVGVSGHSYEVGQIQGVGQLGKYVGTASAASSYSVDCSVTGTPPTACTLRVEGSRNGKFWYAFSDVPVQDCTTPQMIWIANHPVIYLRLNVLSYTPGDSTTNVTGGYTQGGAN